jgi:hypothetical protein
MIGNCRLRLGSKYFDKIGSHVDCVCWAGLVVDTPEYFTRVEVTFPIFQYD